MLRYLWSRTTSITGLCFCIFFAISPKIMAETVVEKIIRTGKLTAGTSKDALPFAYRDTKGELVGYSVDILELITAQLEAEYQQEIELELVPLQPKDRIPSLITGEVDIVCDASSFTWKRDRQIDFSFSYSSTGTRLLTTQGKDLWDTQSLINQRIGVLPKTTNEQSIQRVQPLAKIVPFKDRASGYEALKKGKIDAFASDGILLESWLHDYSRPRKVFRSLETTLARV